MAEFSFDLEDLNRSSGLTIENASVAISLSVFNSGADYNDDGIDDLAVSTTSGGLFNQDLQIIYGDEELPANLDLGSVSGDVTISGDPNNLFNIPIFISNLDFNGDGVDDLITSSFEQPTGGDPALISRLIFGGDELPTTINPSALDGSDGLEFTGDPIILAQGIDINDDGNDDLIFSAGDLEDTVNPSLDSYVYFGDDRDFTSTLNPTVVTGGNGFAINDNSLSLVLGSREDINDDGINDLAINSFNLDSVENIASSSRILFGSETFPGSIDEDTFDGEDGFSIISSDAADNEFITSFFIEDTNDDDISDILVSQITLEETEDGEELDLGNLGTVDELENASNQRIFVVFGDETFDDTVDLADLDGDNGFEIVNSDSDELNLASTTTLDLNNDQLQDFVITDVESESTYVVFGQENFDATVDLADLDGDDGFVFAETTFSFTNTYTGDINGDTLDDLILETDIDRTYVVFGTEDDFGAEFDPTDGDANALVIFAQEADTRISDIIDLNGDGADDLIYEPGLDVESPFLETEPTGIPDIQVVFGDSDIGTGS